MLATFIPCRDKPIRRKMADRAPLCRYKESRIVLEPSSTESIIALRLPTSGRSSKSLPKRARSGTTSVTEEESAFRRNHLASASSIYHRIHHKSPRSFLWKVIEDGTVLSLRAVDVAKQPDAIDAGLTLLFTFPDIIRPTCIALSDPKEHDVLSVFVLLESNQLFTLTLRPDDFRKPASSRARLQELAKTYVSSPFSIKHPYRLVALAADELFFSLHDGGCLKLTRQPGSDGEGYLSSYHYAC